MNELNPIDVVRSVKTPEDIAEAHAWLDRFWPYFSSALGRRAGQLLELAQRKVASND